MSCQLNYCFLFNIVFDKMDATEISREMKMTNKTITFKELNSFQKKMSSKNKHFKDLLKLKLKTEKKTFSLSDLITSISNEDIKKDVTFFDLLISYFYFHEKQSLLSFFNGLNIKEINLFLNTFFELNDRSNKFLIQDQLFFNLMIQNSDFQFLDLLLSSTSLYMQEKLKQSLFSEDKMREKCYFYTNMSKKNYLYILNHYYTYDNFMFNNMFLYQQKMSFIQYFCENDNITMDEILKTNGIKNSKIRKNLFSCLNFSQLDKIPNPIDLISTYFHITFDEEENLTEKFKIDQDDLHQMDTLNFNITYLENTEFNLQQFIIIQQLLFVTQFSLFCNTYFKHKEVVNDKFQEIYEFQRQIFLQFNDKIGSFKPFIFKHKKELRQFINIDAFFSVMYVYTHDEDYLKSIDQSKPIMIKLPSDNLNINNDISFFHPIVSHLLKKDFCGLHFHDLFFQFHNFENSACFIFSAYQLIETSEHNDHFIKNLEYWFNNYHNHNQKTSQKKDSFNQSIMNNIGKFSYQDLITIRNLISKCKQSTTSDFFNMNDFNLLGHIYFKNDHDRTLIAIDERLDCFKLEEFDQQQKNIIKKRKERL